MKPLSKTSDKGSDKTSDKTSDKGSDKTSDKTSDKGSDKGSDKHLDKISDKILECIKTQPKTTIKQLAETIGVSTRTIEIQLQNLKQNHKIIRNGGKKNRNMGNPLKWGMRNSAFGMYHIPNAEFKQKGTKDSSFVPFKFLNY